MSRPKRILIADDVEQSAALLAEQVCSLGYEVEVACDGLDALAKLSLDIDLLLLDVMMPGLDGFEVVRRLRAEPRWAQLPVIMVTVLDSREDRVEAVAAGANDFIAKPVDRSELTVRIASQLRLKEVQDALARSQAELEQRVARRTADLRRALDEMVEARRGTYEAHVDTIRRLVLAAELKDPATAHHILRLSRSSAILARALHLSPGDSETLAHAVTMHDVGKIGIPDAILSKPGLLTPDERKIMETHTVIGSRILSGSSSELMRAGEVIALTHHEWWDGRGYPRGLTGERIPLWGRICTVLDVFDALTTERPYRAPLPAEEALGLMLTSRARQFDPSLLDAFVARREEVVELYESFAGEHLEGGFPALSAGAPEALP